MRKLIKILCLLLLFNSTGEAQQVAFKVQDHGSRFCVSETHIDYELGNQKIGFVMYTKVPLSLYVVHSLFIYPQFRNQGYGKKLLAYTCARLSSAGARVTFIQPGPFEITNHALHNITASAERESKIQKLVKLYQVSGFKPVHRYLSRCVQLAYYLVGLPEDARYLMFRYR